MEEPGLSRNTYESPFNARYASEEMQYLFSSDKKFRTWRRLWIALAESEMELGLGITQAQVDQLRQYADDINYDVAEAFERETRHDVMSHVHAYGAQADLARPIIHLGATSCFVGDNTDILIYAEALQLIRRKVAAVLKRLSVFAREYRRCRRWASPITSRPSWSRWANGRACGCRSCCSTWKNSTLSRNTCVCSATRAPRAHRRVFWSCSKAIMTRCGNWNPGSRKNSDMKK
jgi:hypothetical protein